MRSGTPRGTCPARCGCAATSSSTRSTGSPTTGRIHRLRLLTETVRDEHVALAARDLSAVPKAVDDAATGVLVDVELGVA